MGIRLGEYGPRSFEWEPFTTPTFKVLKDAQFTLLDGGPLVVWDLYGYVRGSVNEVWLEGGSVYIRGEIDPLVIKSDTEELKPEWYVSAEITKAPHEPGDEIGFEIVNLNLVAEPAIPADDTHPC